MIYNRLGKTNIKVSKICFGSLTMGPLQKHMHVNDGAALLKYAFDRGVNFVDMAELYETYPYVGAFLKQIKREDYVIASKCYAYTEAMAEESLKLALETMGTDYIDIFMLHEQMNDMTLKGHEEAINYFIKMKDRGIIRAFGISTHYIEAVRAASKHSEIEVIHPITNMGGLGIQDGTISEMIDAINTFRATGGGVYGMKPFGGGNLLKDKVACYDFVFSAPYLDSVAFGMQSTDEIDQNINTLMGLETPEHIANKLSKHDKKLTVADWCIRCGACVKKCDHGALSLDANGIKIDHTRCVMCGYCAAVCPEFCLKVY